MPNGPFTRDPSKLDPVAQAILKMREVRDSKKVEETPPEEKKE